MVTSANFGFLVAHDRLLDHLGGLAERYFAEDPGTCLMKLRQFGEVLAQRTAARVGLCTSAEEHQAELLSRLRAGNYLPREVADLFHGLRKAGNVASARDNLGLVFTRLRSDGPIVEGLRSAINSAIRRGEVIRYDASRISRAPTNK